MEKSPITTEALEEDREPVVVEWDLGEVDGDVQDYAVLLTSAYY